MENNKLMQSVEMNITDLQGAGIDQKDNLNAALARAQGNYKVCEMNGYTKNTKFESRWATFEDLVVSSREALSAEGLSVVQYLDSFDGYTYLVTELRHKSGEIIPSRVIVNLNDPTNYQQVGSANSYLKRYNYASICGIAASEGDDDGESINGQNSDQKPANGGQKTAPDPSKMIGAITESQLDRLRKEYDKRPFEVESMALAKAKVNFIEEMTKAQASVAISDVYGGK